MSQSPTQPMDPHTAALLPVAEYLSRPAQLMAVTEAHAAFRHTLDMVHQASVVLTMHGEPARRAGVFSYTGGHAWRVTTCACRDDGGQLCAGASAGSQCTTCGTYQRSGT